MIKRLKITLGHGIFVLLGSKGLRSSKLRCEASPLKTRCCCFLCSMGSGPGITPPLTATRCVNLRRSSWRPRRSTARQCHSWSGIASWECLWLTPETSRKRVLTLIARCGFMSLPSIVLSRPASARRSAWRSYFNGVSLFGCWVIPRQHSQTPMKPSATR
jgi:hypothetical protein